MKATQITPDTLVGEIATQAPRLTRVFARHGIDFCCGGGIPLAQAAERRGIPVQGLLAELREACHAAAEPAAKWNEAPLPALIEHIVATHHRPLDEELPRLEAMARKVHQVHGSKDPERLLAVLETVLALRADLEPHMMKEERVLFPMILRGQGAMAHGPIHVMHQEHEDVGRLLARARELTHDYTPPEGACNTWRALWQGLHDLETDLHEHIHLENNILFPRALGPLSAAR